MPKPLDIRDLAQIRETVYRMEATEERLRRVGRSILAERVHDLGYVLDRIVKDGTKGESP